MKKKIICGLIVGIVLILVISTLCIVYSKPHISNSTNYIRVDDRDFEIYNEEKYTCLELDKFDIEDIMNHIGDYHFITFQEWLNEFSNISKEELGKKIFVAEEDMEDILNDYHDCNGNYEWLKKYERHIPANAASAIYVKELTKDCWVVTVKTPFESVDYPVPARKCSTTKWLSKIILWYFR